MLRTNIEPDGFTFASIMTACARLGSLGHSNGLASDAIAIFSRMEVENISPDSVTFIGILTARSHCGWVEEGHKHFDLTNYYSIQPELEHYGAMVDLLGRAGKLEAYAVIKEMTLEPDIVTWSAFLSACRNS